MTDAAISRKTQADAEVSTQLEKRTWCYAQPPHDFEISPCSCGNRQTQWSEYKEHLWCEVCKKDFIPDHGGVFSGPIPLKVAAMLGLRFDRIDLATGKLDRYDIEACRYESEKAYFQAGLTAARAGAAALRIEQTCLLAGEIAPGDRLEFEAGAAQGFAERIARMPLVVKTSNPKKLAEINRFGLGVRAEPGADLAEVDGTPEQVAMYKALSAGPFVLVEDTSLDVEGFSAGVNIRWLLSRLAVQVKESGQSPRAVWRVMLAVHDGEQMFVSKAEVHGRMIAEPRGEGFSFDQFFVPDGYDKTLGELDMIGQKDDVSARKGAVQNLLAGKCTVIPLPDIPAWNGAYQSA